MFATGDVNGALSLHECRLPCQPFSIFEGRQRYRLLWIRRASFITSQGFLEQHLVGIEIDVLTEISI